MTQPGFDFSEPVRPRKRVSVPRTSVLAYQSRPRDKRITVALTWLSRASEPVTSAELAAMSYTADGRPSLAEILTTRRALSDALAGGLVEQRPSRRCHVTTRQCVTWRVVTR